LSAPPPTNDQTNSEHSHEAFNVRCCDHNVLRHHFGCQAQVVVDLSLITCKQLLESDQERQTLISSWMAGYFSASKNLNVVDFRYVKRNGNVIGKYCKTHKSDTVMNAMQKNWR
jgi:acid stress chaperone HdeB